MIAGLHNRILEFGHQYRGIKEYVYHEQFDTPQYHDNDIALITVNTPFDFSDPNVQPIEMFKLDEGAPPEGTICNSTGWGVKKPGAYTYPNALQLVQIPIHSKETCETMYPGYITYGMTCAGGPGTGPCNVRKN